MDSIMLTNPGRRILFQNVLHKDNDQPFEWPQDVDFDATVTLDPKNIIDLAIMIEDRVIEKHGKLPE